MSIVRETGVHGTTQHK